MTDDEWQTHVTREAAKAIGEWLVARGRLHLAIASLDLRDLEGIAGTAISSFIVLTSHRIKNRPRDDPLTRLLLG